MIRNLPRSPLLVAALALTIAATGCVFVGCGDPSSPKDSSPSPVATAAVTSPSAPTTQVPAGTVALFDTRNRTAKRLDLGRSVISADWIDDGHTFLALNMNTQTYVALRTDGSLVREVAHIPQTTRDADGESPLTIVPLIVHDGRRVAIVDFRASTMDLVDVFSGSTERVVDHAYAFGAFSPDGTQFVGSVTRVNSAGLPDPSGGGGSGVFSEHGDCGDDRPFACLEWSR